MLFLDHSQKLSAPEPLKGKAQDIVIELKDIAESAIRETSSHGVLAIAEQAYEKLRHLEKGYPGSLSLPEMVMDGLGKHRAHDNMDDCPYFRDGNADEEETEIVPQGYPLSEYLSLINSHSRHRSYLIQQLRSMVETRRRRSRKRSVLRMQTSGSVDVKRLWRLATGEDRIMKQRTRPLSKDPDNLALYILVDESSSMVNAERVRYARQAVAVLGEVLHELRIPFAITGYTTGSSLIRYLYKEFSDDYISVRTRLVGINGRNGTYTQEHIPYALRRLATRGERRKLLLVVTDAEEIESDSRFQQAVAMAGDEGVRLLGLGINTRSMQEYFGTFVELHNLDGFSEELLRLLKQVLTA